MWLRVSIGQFCRTPSLRWISSGLTSIWISTWKRWDGTSRLRSKTRLSRKVRLTQRLLTICKRSRLRKTHWTGRRSGIMLGSMGSAAIKMNKSMRPITIWFTDRNSCRLMPTRRRNLSQVRHPHYKFWRHAKTGRNHNLQFKRTLKPSKVTLLDQ